jgi:hypothetical protein
MENLRLYQEKTVIIRFAGEKLYRLSKCSGVNVEELNKGATSAE